MNLAKHHSKYDNITDSHSRIPFNITPAEEIREEVKSKIADVFSEGHSSTDVGEPEMKTNRGLKEALLLTNSPDTTRKTPIKSMTGQYRAQDNIASLRVLVSKQDLLFVVATRFAICDIILSTTLSYHALLERTYENLKAKT